MAITDNKILSWTNPIVNEADRPQRTASEMKAVFDSNANQLRVALNGLIDDLGTSGAAELPAAPIEGVNGGTVEEQLLGLKIYADEREAAAKKYADTLSFESGAADMRKSVYDPQGKGQDVFAYTDTAKAELKGMIAAKENKSTTTTATLLASGWVEDGEEYTQTVAVEGMTPDKNIVVASHPDSNTVYKEAGVYCSEQDTDALVFKATDVPESDLVANILAIGG